jgi:hypothetical protein
MHRISADDAVKQLGKLRVNLCNVEAHIKGKKTLRASEKAMSLADVRQKIEAIDFAVDAINKGNADASTSGN